MTVAALQALALREEVRRDGPPDPRRWLRRVARIVAAPWDMAVGGDLALPGVEGPRTARTRLLGAYIARFHAAAVHDPRLAVAFARVMALVDPPTALLRPGTAVRVVLAGRRTPFRDGGLQQTGPVAQPFPDAERHEELRR